MARIRELQLFKVGPGGSSDLGIRLPIDVGSFAAIRTVDFVAP